MGLELPKGPIPKELWCSDPHRSSLETPSHRVSLNLTSLRRLPFSGALLKPTRGNFYTIQLPEALLPISAIERVTKKQKKMLKNEMSVGLWKALTVSPGVQQAVCRAVHMPRMTCLPSDLETEQQELQVKAELSAVWLRVKTDPNLHADPPSKVQVMRCRKPLSHHQLTTQLMGQKLQWQKKQKENKPQRLRILQTQFQRTTNNYLLKLAVKTANPEDGLNLIFRVMIFYYFKGSIFNNNKNVRHAKKKETMAHTQGKGPRRMCP